jgi:hypothetical protein
MAMALDNQDIRWFSMLGVVILVAFVYALVPRYEFKTTSDEKSVSVIVYDRWTGRFQRAVYDNSGGLNIMGAYTPFGSR